MCLQQTANIQQTKYAPSIFQQFAIRLHSRPENFKKSRPKKLVKSNRKINFFSWNCISSSFKLFPSSKNDFWPFLKLQKMEFGQKIFFVKLIYLISRVFLAWTFLNFLAVTILRIVINVIYLESLFTISFFTHF